MLTDPPAVAIVADSPAAIGAPVSGCRTAGPAPCPPASLASRSPDCGRFFVVRTASSRAAVMLAVAPPLPCASAGCTTTNADASAVCPDASAMR